MLYFKESCDLVWEDISPGFQLYAHSIEKQIEQFISHLDLAFYIFSCNFTSFIILHVCQMLLQIESKGFLITINFP